MVTSFPNQSSSTPTANPSIQTGPIPKETGKVDSSSTDAETLLRALRNVIIPFLRPADKENKHDADENALRPDGEEFIIALQKFMTSFLRSQRGPAGGVEVELSGCYLSQCLYTCSEIEKPETSSAHDNHGNSGEDASEPESIPNTGPPADESLAAGVDHSFINVTDAHVDTEPLRDRVVPESERSEDHQAVEAIVERAIPSDIFAQGSQFVERLLKALRVHVFNTMPIHLLCFKPHGSKLQITLVKRGEIYARIAPNLETNINFSNVSHEINELMGSSSEQNAEKYVIEKLIRKYSKYAILSHTWLHGRSGEITYGDWNGGEFDVQHPGYQKLLNFCKIAWEDHGISFGWMDTICINKDSSAELDESIRSMHKWYRDADVCITYLAETNTLSDMPNDRWFTRGWTLQELLAPLYIKFYNVQWNKLVKSLDNDKRNPSIQKQIEQATTITAYELTAPAFGQPPISRRMEMAAKRQVTREEDGAYCLMGIFDVSISIAYGEGAEHAFSRLLREILNSSHRAVDLFNWAGSFGSRISSLLPPTLQGYLRRSSYKPLYLWKKPIEPLILTHLGLRITIILMPAISIQYPTSPYVPIAAIGDYHAMVRIITLVSDSGELYDRGNYSILDARIESGDTHSQEEKSSSLLMLGVLNVAEGDHQTISVPKHCLAVSLVFHKGNVSVIPTGTPIIFTLSKTLSPDGGEPGNYTAWNDSYSIERSELVIHGMELDTLYL